MNWARWEADEDGCYICEEGQTYLFAVPLASGGFEYFVDAVVWDAETPPSWRDDQSGWCLDAPTYFCAIARPE